MELRIADRLDEKTETLIKNIIGAAIDVHRELGPGYLEKIYEKAMSIELNHRGLSFSVQKTVPIYYKGIEIHDHILDMVVEEKVILEFKSLEKIHPIHEAQILSYLKSSGLSAGLLINFKERLVKDGIRRFVWGNHE